MGFVCDRGGAGPGGGRGTPRSNDAESALWSSAGLVRFRDFLPAVRRFGVQSNAETR